MRSRPASLQVAPHGALAPLRVSHAVAGLARCVTVEEVVEATGFDLVVPDDVPESRLPTDIELQLIREVLDPEGLRKAEFGG